MDLIDRLVSTLTDNSRKVIVVMLLLTLVMVPGLGMLEQSSSFDQFQGSTTESQKLDYIDENFEIGNQNTTSAQVIVRGENVLSKDSLLNTLQAQQSLLRDDAIRETLVEENAVDSPANAIAIAGIQQDSQANASDTSLDAQIAQLQSMSASELDAAIGTALSGESQSSSEALALMPKDYEASNTSADAMMLMVTQNSGGGGGLSSGVITETQLSMQTIFEQSTDGGQVMVYGSGIMSDEIDSSMSDSIVIIGPLAFLFVFLSLAIAYRDVIDIGLGLLGIGFVLLWTLGFMGWVGIKFNQMMVPVVVLLIGLSIDYAIHTFMRHREERQDESSSDSARSAMKVALAGVGIALIWVTATTAIGFLSNVVSPIPPVREFGMASAVGITTALVIFGLLIPALKIEIDSFLEGRGWDRKKPPFGTGGGRLSSALTVGSKAARKAPIVVLLLAVVVSGVGMFGATQIETSSGQEDFIAEDPPGWMDSLPGPLAPSDYTAKNTLNYLNANFFSQDSQAQVLAEGDVTQPESLAALNEAVETSASSPVTVTVDGEARVQGPASVMEQVASENESFNQTLAAADTDGDGVPDQNLGTVYDELFEVAPQQAAGVIHQTDSGEYEAARLVVTTDGSASGSKVTSEMRTVANDIEAGSSLEATATGDTIVGEISQNQLLDSIIQSLIIALIAVLAFLAITYRVSEGSATLGAVTVLPVVFSVTWIFGSMHLLDIPFNIFTGMISSLTVGLGVAYSIHISERYNQELERTDSMWTAMDRAVTGTGGALLGSAATTIGGFGVLAFAILPPLQQFGIITALTILYAFIASMVVLPSLLVLWTRYLGPEVHRSESDTTAESAAVAAED